MANYDVIVVGAGLVGLSAALSFSQMGYQVALVEAKPFKLPTLANPDEWDSRIYAITPGNVAWLKKLNVWQFVDQTRVTDIQKMQVWGDDLTKSLNFDAYEAHVENLGLILESRILEHAMQMRIGQEANIRVIDEVLLQDLTYKQDKVEVLLASGEKLNAKLLLAADGVNSWVRQKSQIEVSLHQYAQAGVVANFETELPHQGIARQWFRNDGVLAWLPLSGNRISIVWSTQEWQDLVSLDEEELSDKVAKAGGEILGKMQVVTKAQAFPLRKQIANRLIASRLVLLGDAAHCVHPLAGQGVNLGFRDVIMLEEVMQANVKHQEDIGDLYLLRHYERARKSDVMAISGVTHGLQTLYTHPHPFVKKLRNFGLGLVDGTDFAKVFLMQHAMS